MEPHPSACSPPSPQRDCLCQADPTAVRVEKGSRIGEEEMRDKTPFWPTCSSETTSARPMPTAESTPEKRCTKMVRIPRARAIAQACCPPAPPKEASTCCDTSYPRI